MTPEQLREAQAKQAEVGAQGERWVLVQEKKRLTEAGRVDLADEVRHTALTNVAAGYDIMSFETSGEPRYVEVKSTAGTDPAGFFLSANEWRKATEYGEKYVIYRVTEVGSGHEKVKLYPDICNLVLQQQLMQVATTWKIVRAE